MDRANVKVLPPILLFGAFALGQVGRVIFPDAGFPGKASRWLGPLVIALSIPLVGSALYEMAKARTAVDVRRPTTTLVSSGVFGLSRNPIYLSMILLYLGISLLVDSPPMALVGLPLGGVLCVAVIKPEERYLDQKFGAIYHAYTARVRRWI